MSKEKSPFKQRVLRGTVEYLFPLFAFTSGSLDLGASAYWLVSSQTLRSQLQIIIEKLPSTAGFYERAYYEEQRHSVGLIDEFSIRQSLLSAAYIGFGAFYFKNRKKISFAILDS